MSANSQLIDALKAKANALRIHSIEATTAAGSGHPTTCMSAADVIAVLFFHVMKWDPQNPDNPAQDRFILSKGHGAPVLYAAWAEAGVFPAERLLTLREIDSDLEGHPTPRLPFVDVATGSLGQGLGAGVGLAINARIEKYDYKTYVMLGDGESAEGSVWEAAQLAGIYDLKNLVAIVDANRLGQSQATAPGHDVDVYAKRFEAFGWNAAVVDGHRVEELLAVFEKAASSDKPFAVIARTYKGYGVSFVQDKDAWHGKPLSKDDAAKAVAELREKGATSDYKLEIPAPPKAERKPRSTAVVPAPEYKLGDVVATREAYGTALQKLGAAREDVVALDADTKNSTFSDRFMKSFPERFVECFIAEQNMISVAAGLAARGKVPFASTFAVFLSRGYDQVRMAGISKSNIKLCGSHVGVSIGEDGPSQMGLEDLALFRAIPGGVVFYPSDAVSAERAVTLAADYEGFAYIRTSRPKTPVIYDANEEFAVGKGKVVRAGKGAKVAIATAGITLYEAIKAADTLAADGIEISIVDLFTIKPIDKDLLSAVGSAAGAILTVEDHYCEGGIGEAVSSALSTENIPVYRIGVTEVPRSGPPDALVAKYGIDAAAITKKVREILSAR